MTLVHTKQNSYRPFPLSVSTVHLPSSFLSPLLVAVVFVRLGKITKRCFVRGCSCWNSTRSSWREKGAGGSTTPPCRSQNIRLQSCASLPPPPTHTHAHTSSEHPYPTPAHTQTNIIPCQNTNTVTPTKQQYSNMHMSKDCLSGNTAHSNKCASLESFIRWENVGRKLEKQHK